MLRRELDSHRYRNLAEEARTMAAEMTVEINQLMMERIAEQYDRLAENAERR